MALVTTVTLTDDTDNKVRADETVSFALDGAQYEIGSLSHERRNVAQCDRAVRRERSTGQTRRMYIQVGWAEIDQLERADHAGYLGHVLTVRAFELIAALSRWGGHESQLPGPHSPFEDGTADGRELTPAAATGWVHLDCRWSVAGSRRMDTPHLLPAHQWRLGDLVGTRLGRPRRVTLHRVEGAGQAAVAIVHFAGDSAEHRYPLSRTEVVRRPR